MGVYEFDPVKKVLHRQKWLPKWIRVIRWDRPLLNGDLPWKLYWYVLPCIVFPTVGLKLYKSSAYCRDLYLCGGDPVEKEKLKHYYYYNEIRNYDIDEYSNDSKPAVDVPTRRLKYPQYYADRGYDRKQKYGFYGA